MAKKSANVANPTVKIPVDFIYSDYEFNARKVEGESEEYAGVETLAKQIKVDGLLSPIMVRKIPEAELEEYDGETYTVVFGFRRLAAVRVLEWDSIQAQIVPDGMTEMDAQFVNLAENVSRNDLKPWEKAQRYAEMKSEYELSGHKIANRLGENPGHVNNLIRIVEIGNPKIVQLWKDGHPKAGTDALIRRVIKKDTTHDEQWELWLEHAGLVTEEGEGDGDGEEGEEKAVKTKRPSAKQLENGLEALKECDGKSDEWKAGCTAALRWALGKTKTLPNVYDPRKTARPAAEEEAA